MDEAAQGAYEHHKHVERHGQHRDYYKAHEHQRRVPLEGSEEHIPAEGVQHHAYDAGGKAKGEYTGVGEHVSQPRGHVVQLARAGYEPSGDVLL